MAEEDGVTVTGHVIMVKRDGITVADLRLFLEAVDCSPLPDTTEVRVRTSWNVNRDGARVRKITAVVPE